jgi:GWxTD domain-containing protein
MNYFRLGAVAVCLTLSASSAFANLSQNHVNWGNSAVQFLMTRNEARDWKAIKTDAAAEEFIELFWARRDPNPATVENSFKADFEARAALADQHFSTARQVGSTTDRGRVFLLLGPPTRMVTAGRDSIGNVESGFSTDGQGNINQKKFPTERWIYDKDQVPSYAPGRNAFEVVFSDYHASGEYKMERGKVDLANLFNRSAESTLVNPKLTLAQLQQVRSQAAPAAPAAPAAATAGLTNAALRSAVEAARTASGDFKPLSVSWGEFVTADGHGFVALNAALPRGTAGVAANAPATFFGEIVTADGTVVASFEDATTIASSKSDLYVERSLDLAPGKYTGWIGVAVNGTPVAMTRKELDVAALEPSAPSHSRLILSNNIYPLTEAQNPTDPFAFGGLKVVPKSDKLFSQQDELWYFVELRNPAVDEEGKAKVQIGVEFIRASDKRSLKAPLQEIPVEELRGVPGHYGIGSSIPLASLQPDEYEVKVTVLDMHSKKKYELSESFKLAAQ